MELCAVDSKAAVKVHLPVDWKDASMVKKWVGKLVVLSDNWKVEWMEVSMAAMWGIEMVLRLAEYLAGKKAQLSVVALEEQKDDYLDLMMAQSWVNSKDYWTVHELVVMKEIRMVVLMVLRWVGLKDIQRVVEWGVEKVVQLVLWWDSEQVAGMDFEKGDVMVPYWVDVMVDVMAVKLDDAKVVSMVCELVALLVVESVGEPVAMLDDLKVVWLVVLMAFAEVVLMEFVRDVLVVEKLVSLKVVQSVK